MEGIDGTGLIDDALLDHVLAKVANDDLSLLSLSSMEDLFNDDDDDRKQDGKQSQSIPAPVQKSREYMAYERMLGFPPPIPLDTVNIIHCGANYDKMLAEYERSKSKNKQHEENKKTESDSLDAPRPDEATYPVNAKQDPMQQLQKKDTRHSRATLSKIHFELKTSSKSNTVGAASSRDVMRHDSQHSASTHVNATSHSASSVVALHRVLTPTENDVLFARGSSAVPLHSGNIHFRDLVSQRLIEHNKPLANKRAIYRQVIAQVRASGGRFLKRESTDSQFWVEIASENDILTKMNYAFRRATNVAKAGPTKPPPLPAVVVATTKEKPSAVSTLSESDGATAMRKKRRNKPRLNEAKVAKCKAKEAECEAKQLENATLMDKLVTMKAARLERKKNQLLREIEEEQRAEQQQQQQAISQFFIQRQQQQPVPQPQPQLQLQPQSQPRLHSVQPQPQSQPRRRSERPQPQQRSEQSLPQPQPQPQQHLEQPLAISREQRLSEELTANYSRHLSEQELMMKEIRLHCAARNAVKSLAAARQQISSSSSRRHCFCFCSTKKSKGIFMSNVNGNFCTTKKS